MNKKPSPTGVYYASKMAMLRRMLQRTKLELSDYMALPEWVKEDLLVGWGCKGVAKHDKDSKNAQDRLWEKGLKLSTYKPGFPESIFPKGLVHTGRRNRRTKNRVTKTVSPI